MRYLAMLGTVDIRLFQRRVQHLWKLLVVARLLGWGANEKKDILYIPVRSEQYIYILQYFSKKSKKFWFVTFFLTSISSLVNIDPKLMLSLKATF